MSEQICHILSNFSSLLLPTVTEHLNNTDTITQHVSFRKVEFIEYPSRTTGLAEFLTGENAFTTHTQKGIMLACLHGVGRYPYEVVWTYMFGLKLCFYQSPWVTYLKI